MTETQYRPAAERRTRDRSMGIELRRRLKQQVEVERRRSGHGTAEIGSALEMHLDQFKTRRGMIGLLERWLVESRNAAPTEQDADYITSLERSIAMMKEAPDVETGIAMMHRRP